MSDETPYAPLGVDPEWLNSSCCLFVQRITFPNEQIENIWTPDSVYIYTMCIYIYIYIWRDSKCNHHLEPFEHCRQQGWSSRKPTLIQPSRWYFPYLPILLFSRRFLGPTGEMFPEPRISAVLGDFELYSLPPLVPSLFDWRQYHVGTALKPREILRPCHASVTRLQAPLALTN